MQIHLSDHFTYRRLLRFVAPSIATMVFLSIYGVVDGYFVSNYVGETPFAAVNLIYPFLMLLTAFGSLLETGGNAVVSILLGEGEPERANRCFSMFVETAIGLGLLFSLLGWVFMPQVARLLGAEGEILENCVIYGRILCPSGVFFLLQSMMQTFFVTAEKPRLSFVASVFSGFANIFFDWLLIVVFPFGIRGAAFATALSQLVGGGFSLLWFLLPNGSLLRLRPAPIDFKTLARATANGSSEMVTSLSLSLVSMLYNLQLIRLAGDAGVAAYGVIMYVNFIFLSVLIGYSFGSASLFGYHHGAQNHAELKNLFAKSHVLLAVTGAAMAGLAAFAARPLANLFVGYDPALCELTVRAFRIYSCAYFFVGFNIFASGFFTALGNGLVSAVLSFLRTLLLQTICVTALPYLLGLDGVWISRPSAEALALLCSYAALRKYKNRYHYA